MTTRLIEGIIAAAEALGSDGKGKDGLKGYYLRLAQEDPKLFAALLGRALTLQPSNQDQRSGDARIVIVPAKEPRDPPKVRPLVAPGT